MPITKIHPFLIKYHCSSKLKSALKYMCLKLVKQLPFLSCRYHSTLSFTKYIIKIKTITKTEIKIPYPDKKNRCVGILNEICNFL
jgi:hypothetical protein